MATLLLVIGVVLIGVVLIGKDIERSRRDAAIAGQSQSMPGRTGLRTYSVAK